MAGVVPVDTAPAFAWSPDGRTLAIAVDAATVALVGIPNGGMRRVWSVGTSLQGVSLGWCAQGTRRS